MSPFSNNLRRGDRVMHAPTKRLGDVVKRPWTSRRAVSVLFQGDKEERRVDVMDLRLVVEGVPEECPPINGVPPELGAAPAKREGPPADLDPLDVLKRRRAELKSQMDEMNERFKALRILADRTDNAIKALEATG